MTQEQQRLIKDRVEQFICDSSISDYSEGSVEIEDLAGEDCIIDLWYSSNSYEHRSGDRDVPSTYTFSARYHCNISFYTPDTGDLIRSEELQGEIS